jgi:hypothetical protein
MAYASTPKTEMACSSETWLSFTGLRGAISQETELIVTTAARASNPTYLLLPDADPILRYFHSVEVGSIAKFCKYMLPPWEHCLLQHSANTQEEDQH